MKRTKGRTMKRRILGLVAVLLACAGLAYATGAYYSATIAATAVNSSITFTDNRSGGTSAAFAATHIVLINDGPNAVYVDLGDTTATTADRKVASGESFSATWDVRLGGEGWAGMGLICAGGETASIRVWAER